MLSIKNNKKKVIFRYIDINIIYLYKTCYKLSNK